ncbi:MAG: SUMF1/EgtB/PvdO family nonheme iron enzyme [Candidatus Scalinduaceae bacterium]
MSRFLNKYLIPCWLFMATTIFVETVQSNTELYNKCPECGTRYSNDIKFCGKDGTKLVETQRLLVCPKCKMAGVPGETFCRQDGEKLITAEEAVLDEQKLLENKTEALKHLKEGNKFSDNKELDKALEEYKKAVDLYPDLPELQYNIGWLYGKIGMQEKAIEHLRRYITLVPDAKDIDKVVSYIAVLQTILNKKKKLMEKHAQRDSVMKEALPGIKEKCDMVLIPAGPFVMGINDIKREQRPSHKVYVDAFYIDRYEVTNAQYYEFLDYIKKTNDHSKCRTDEPGNKDHTPLNWEDDYYNHPEYPVVRVDWYDAYAYASWAGKRLPTEAEWEKAARGTDERKWPWGNEWDPEKCNIGDPEPIGRHDDGKSPYGCYDMAGSVAEWCTDWGDMLYYTRSPKNNPKGPEKGNKKIIRGGSRFGNLGILLRCTARKSMSPNLGNMSVGFRCVK